MEELAAEIKSLFYDDYLIEAYRKLQAAEADTAFAEAYPDVEEFKIIKNTVTKVDKLLAELGDLDSWRLVYEEGEIATFYKGTGQNFLMRAELLLEAPLFPVLALFSEVDLYHNWVPKIQAFEMIAEPTRFIKLLQYTLDLPWPVSNRDVCLSCQGVAIGQNKSCLIVLSDLEEPFLGNPPVEVAQGSVRINIPIGCINIMYRGPESTQVSLIINAQPHVALIPQWLINWSTKQVFFWFMNSIREQVFKFKGSEYETRVEQRAEYYEELKKRIHKYIET